MPEFDPEKFEQKYRYYFEELETAYSNAYQQLHGEVDSHLLQTIDRQVLSESEPVYEGEGQFRVVIPDDVEEHGRTLVSDEETYEAVLAEFVTLIENELVRLFGFES